MEISRMNILFESSRALSSVIANLVFTLDRSQKFISVPFYAHMPGSVERNTGPKEFLPMEKCIFYRYIPEFSLSSLILRD